MNERERIALLKARFPTIGDDCAIFTASATGKQLVWTIDAQVEGTHFRREWLSWEDVGYRSFMAAASDIAAMGATPIGALAALALNDTIDDDAFEQLTRGQAAAAALVGAPILGGNLARGTETSITTTVLGHATKPIARGGAQPGDRVLLGGPVGIAAAGLRLLECGMEGTAIDAWRRPTARIALGHAMVDRANAAVDVSDGLARDAGHIAGASKVKIVLEETSLRAVATSALKAAATMLAIDPLELMLDGGEDYALVVTSPQSIDGFVPIGRVEMGEGVILEGAGGTSRALDSRGFDHFG